MKKMSLKIRTVSKIKKTKNKNSKISETKSAHLLNLNHPFTQMKTCRQFRIKALIKDRKGNNIKARLVKTISCKRFKCPRIQTSLST